MKIAAVTDDGKTISAHFGWAQYYLVLTVEDGKVVAREMREKANHQQGEDHQNHHGHGAGEHHHHGHNHGAMAEAVRDCQVVLTGGMGRPAYESLKLYGLEPIITSLRDIDEAAQAFLAGNLRNQVERLH